MSENLYRFVICVNNLRNKLLIIKILLNVTNIFMFRIMQSFKRKSLKNIMIIYCQITLKIKRL